QRLAPADRQRALDRHLDLADREGAVDAEARQVEGAREVRFKVEAAHRVDTGDRVPADDVLGRRLRDLRRSAGAALRDRATRDRMRTAGVGQYLRRERTVQRREDRQTREPEAPRDDEKHGSSRRVTDALPFVMDRVVRFYASLYGRVRVSDRRLEGRIAKDVARVTPRPRIVERGGAWRLPELSRDAAVQLSRW